MSETGTGWVRSLFRRNAGHRIFVARITAVEVTSAVARRRKNREVTANKASSILSRFRQHLVGRYIVLEMTSGLLTDAMRLANTHTLRAYDAVQLAAALELNRLSGGGIVFVCSDRRLNLAAIAEGLATDDPNAHP